MLLVGLDAASRLDKFGYAIGTLANGQISVSDVGLLKGKGDPGALERLIVPALRDAERALIAIDAPLGWPKALVPALAHHSAGAPISTTKAAMFARRTDEVVYRKIGKRPLEVAADKIARAAHTALEVLDQLRLATAKPLPLAWRFDTGGCAVIEVYPAATLKARGLDDSGYKKRDEKEKAVRRRIAQALREEVPELESLMDASADEFDACLCLVAAKDFLECETFEPEDQDLARREGWIWVRTPSG